MRASDKEMSTTFNKDEGIVTLKSASGLSNTNLVGNREATETVMESKYKDSIEDRPPVQSPIKAIVSSKEDLTQAPSHKEYRELKSKDLIADCGLTPPHNLSTHSVKKDLSHSQHPHSSKSDH